MSRKQYSIVNIAFSWIALESSLWELSALEKHYHPAVAALAKACGKEDYSSLPFDMEDFLCHTYKSLFEEESNKLAVVTSNSKKRKKAVPLTFVEPTRLIPEGDLLTEILEI